MGLTVDNGGSSIFEKCRNYISWLAAAGPVKQLPVTTMGNKEKELMELSAKVMQGMKKAMRKLVENSAAENKKLVVGVIQ